MVFSLSVLTGIHYFQPAGNPGIWSLWGSFLSRCCISLPVSRLTLPQCNLPAAAWELFSSSQCGTNLFGHTAAYPVTAGDHPSTGACWHAQQYARDNYRLCWAGHLHQPQCQSDSDAAPCQPDGYLQLWAPALVQAAECWQCRGPQVRMPKVTHPFIQVIQVWGSPLAGWEKRREGEWAMLILPFPKSV